MTQNPNTLAALIAGAASAGIQWLVARYGHQSVSKYWSDAITTAVTAAVLYVGKDGIKGAFRRIWDGAASVWSGAAGS